MMHDTTAEKMMDLSEIAQIEKQYGANNYTVLGDAVLSRGEGVWLYDMDGNR